MRRPSNTTSRWLAAVLLLLALHYVWELAHSRLFTNYAGAPRLDHALDCLGHAVADVVIASVAYLLTAALVGRLAWVWRPRWLVPAVVWIGLGLAATVAIERLALAGGWWGYTDRMPTVRGVAVTPLLQWLVVPAATLLAVRLWLAPRRV